MRDQNRKVPLKCLGHGSSPVASSQPSANREFSNTFFVPSFLSLPAKKSRSHVRVLARSRRGRESHCDNGEEEIILQPPTTPVP